MQNQFDGLFDLFFAPPAPTEMMHTTKTTDFQHHHHHNHQTKNQKDSIHRRAGAKGVSNDDNEDKIIHNNDEDNEDKVIHNNDDNNEDKIIHNSDDETTIPPNQDNSTTKRTTTRTFTAGSCFVPASSSNIPNEELQQGEDQSSCVHHSAAPGADGGMPRTTRRTTSPKLTRYGVLAAFSPVVLMPLPRHHSRPCHQKEHDSSPHGDQHRQEVDDKKKNDQVVVLGSDDSSSSSLQKQSSKTQQQQQLQHHHKEDNTEFMNSVYCSTMSMVPVPEFCHNY